MFEKVAKANPDLPQILGALILGADHPLTLNEIRKILEAEEVERRAETAADANEPVTDEDLLAVNSAKENSTEESSTGIPACAQETITAKTIKTALEDLQATLRTANIGMDLIETSEGYRLQTSPDCGPWVRRMLNRGKPTRISRPMIETLAIVAYRQPISRSEIESIRGVSVGHVVKALMEMQLVKIVGRSDLPGRPFLFGTTPVFLEHFGLKSLDDLNAVQPGVERTPPEEQKAKHIKSRAEQLELPEPSATLDGNRPQSSAIADERTPDS